MDGTITTDNEAGSGLVLGINLPESIRPGAEGARASLAAVRAAQAAARERARRDTFRARVGACAVVTALLVGLFVLRPRLNRRGTATAGTTSAAVAAVAVPAAAAAPAAPVTPSAAEAPPPEQAPPPATGPATAAASALPVAVPIAADVAPAPIDVTPPAPSAVTATRESAAGCGDLFRRHQWRRAVEACAAAFEAQPNDATLALKVAKAQHARNRMIDAGVWAERSLALEPKSPEALAIVAHAEIRAGHPAAATAAYRRYLALAPRGWHAAEARAALKAAAARTPERRARAARGTPADVTADDGA